MDRLVSIVVPAYNPPKELFKACIESIIEQNYSNFEVVVIDDGSKNEFAEYMDEIASQDNRIQVIHQINTGVCGARNAGMQKASGDYMVFVDADDCLGAGWLNYAMQIAEETNADVVCGKVIMCEKKPSHNSAGSYEYRFFEKDELWKIQRDMLKGKTALLNGVDYLDVGSCAKLFKHTVINEVKFPVGIKLSEDQVFNHEALSKCNSYVITNYDSYYYIMNAGSVSHMYHADAVQIMMYSLEIVKSCLIDNPEVKKAFNYHVVDDLQKALQFSFFNSSKRFAISTITKGVSQSLRNELASNALMSVNRKMYASRRQYFKVWLLKRKMAFIYVVLKTIYLRKR